MSIDVAYSSVPAKRPCLTVGWKLLEQGPESQSASAIRLGGVSAVISASDLDDHTLHPDRRTAYPLSCSLPSGRNPRILMTTCSSLDTLAVSAHPLAYCPGMEAMLSGPYPYQQCEDWLKMRSAAEGIQLSERAAVNTSDVDRD